MQKQIEVELCLRGEDAFDLTWSLKAYLLTKSAESARPPKLRQQVCQSLHDGNNLPIPGGDKSHTM